MAQVRIGISGWRYAPWRGVFYPAGLPQRAELDYAAAVFGSIEINGSFYSLQRPESYAAWYRQTPADFVFALKGPRYITHMLKLRDSGQALANFLASGVFNLREKLGPILWQLPPNLGYDPQRLESFFALLPHDMEQALSLARKRARWMKGRARLAIESGGRIRHALEFRHPSFLQPSLVDLLRKHGIALVIAESAGRFPQAHDITADFVYMRLHGDKELYRSGYTQQALSRWAKRIEAWHRGGEPADAMKIVSGRKPPARKRDVYCFFDNTDAKLRAPFDAQTLVAQLGSQGVPARSAVTPAASPSPLDQTPADRPSLHQIRSPAAESPVARQRRRRPAPELPGRCTPRQDTA
jgi:uncharacterized protein YecE (DUF72 family)